MELRNGSGSQFLRMNALTSSELQDRLWAIQQAREDSEERPRPKRSISRLLYKVVLLTIVWWQDRASILHKVTISFSGSVWQYCSSRDHTNSYSSGNERLHFIRKEKKKKHRFDKLSSRSTAAVPAHDLEFHS